MSVLGPKTLGSSAQATHAEGPRGAKVRPETDNKAQRNEVAILFVCAEFPCESIRPQQYINQGTNQEKR